ncbi:NAD(P)HX epimerase / NAD(P)HX dehydratase [Candidatus Burkholderia verschuerenii]|uniref:Bifunctional NAD(P)H-hydrate repair enzyme n=1 Tax=Candidatus Burkholderia verschuerenii TaxID=242163 RepID=A0A0L0MBL4_9BURK|nr:bifunctional ADP-dependent NAD(P)H-hydrate dehydratase/NAD(P)H-hydrate epimerase [Candidatus Burkholderia verschuerenii]KND59753.1 NAD(P)HX epimerase / NAD(P)HX dehydratase [Candidatus Burkholderia verschuerenii]
MTALQTSPYFSPHDDTLALLTLAELRALEARAAAALPPHTLMARAGDAAAQCLLDALERDPDSRAQPVWIATGPGNNGGDALVMAERLHRAGVTVTVCMPAEVKPDDARWALELARAAGVAIESEPGTSLDAYGWLVDGMFGIGLTRPLDGVFARMAASMTCRARASGRVLALDVPSGLNSDTGAPVADGEAVRATDTITFIGAKPGHYTALGRDLCGRLYVATIGVEPPGAPSIALNAPTLFAELFPPRDNGTNKGTFGTLAIIGGDTGMCGAPVLAARMALYGGAGKVNVAFLGEGFPPYDPPHPELMLHRVDDFALDKMDAFAIGCGMGQSDRAKKVFADALNLDVPKLLDADALNLVAADDALAAIVAQRGAKGDPCILTPHPLEAARLLQSDAKSVQADRLQAARQLAARYGAIAVLKGSGTIVAAPDGRVAINPTGNAGLATGGTGDVLGGLIGALLAQNLPAYEAALAGVWLHGLAAQSLSDDGIGPAGLTAGELAPRVRSLINRRFYAR